MVGISNLMRFSNKYWLVTMVVLLYFDKLKSVNASPGLSFLGIAS